MLAWIVLSKMSKANAKQSRRFEPALMGDLGPAKAEHSLLPDKAGNSSIGDRNDGHLGSR